MTDVAASASDATLVRGALDGDRAAFAQLYDRRARLVRAVCYDTTRDLQASADLTQEVFLRAWEKLAGLREPGKFSAWVTGIARQVCREWRRRRGKEGFGTSRLAEGRENPGNSSFAPLRDDVPFAPLRDDVPFAPLRGDLVVPQILDVEIRELRDAVAGLPERERLALHAFYLQEQDVEQARAVVGLSRSGFYHLLAGARRRLRLKLRGQEVA